MDSVYIETSVISHATAWPSKVPATAVMQEQAKRWMHDIRPKYNVVTSQYVLDEAAQGDSEAARHRLEMLADIRLLQPHPQVDAVVHEMISRSLVPQVAKLDAVHVATAALAGVQYLLTQNCRHIANATVLPRLYRLLEALGLPGLLICTPAQFLGGTENAEK